MFLNIVFVNIFAFYFFYNLVILKFLFILVGSKYSYFLNTLNMFYLVNDRFFLNYILVLILNISGIPPFLGFFLKVSLLPFLNNTYFFAIFFLFFSFLFLSLWFYLKNLKFLLLDNFSFFQKSLFISNPSPSTVEPLLYVTFYVVFLFGCLFLDDFILFSYYFLNL